jgi:CNT family concentrative nucleoside transporter
MSDPTFVPAPAPAPPPPPPPPTPLSWRLGIFVVVCGLTLVAYGLHHAGALDPRGQSLFGIVCFLGVAAMVSANLRAVSLRTLLSGIALQLGLALFVLKFEVFGVRPGYALFQGAGWVAKEFLKFSDEGAKFVFGALANPPLLAEKLGPSYAVVFAFKVLPTIIFVSSFFSVLYYLGVLQWVVRVMARVMAVIMGTSGAETLSVSANVFMGQTEAPLIIKPYIPRMTKSELLALMIGGMAHISGALMAVYIGFVGEQNAAAILATSVMAAPASLYLSKLVLPELEVPETKGEVKSTFHSTHANPVDAAAAGASEGLSLALNVAAMLIAFLAGLAMIDALLGAIKPGLTQALTHLGAGSDARAYLWFLPDNLSLRLVFSNLFAPVAFLMGVEMKDVPALADLLGTKLVANEFVAYTKLRDVYWDGLSPRSVTLATYALTGFANFSSIGIQLGGIGAMAPERRADLARLSGRALLAGFLATLINASIAGLLI